MTLHRCGLRGLSGSLSSFIYTKVSHLCSRIRLVQLTLTTSPAQPDPATSDGETLHLFDRSLSVWLADELNESTVFPSRNFNL